MRAIVALLGISLVLALWVSGNSTSVSADGITVDEGHHKVDFPGAATLSVSATSEMDIVEIQLLYRGLGDETWSDAYLDFTPGPEVTASAELKFSGTTYLPPGAELEYYYVVRDSAGNLQQSSSAVIEFLDDRFQWDRTQIGPLELLHHDVRKDEVAQVVMEVEVALDKLRRLLPRRLLPQVSSKSMKGVIYNNDAEAQSALPRQGQTALQGEQIFGGFAFPSNGVFVAIGFQTTVIVHEATHLLLDQAVGKEALPLPGWLDEGLANHYMPPEWKRFSGTRINSKGLPVSEMIKLPESPRAVAIFYQKSESVVTYLIQQHGEEPFRRFIRHLGEGRTAEDALIQSHGFGIGDLEDRWSRDERWPSLAARNTAAGGSSGRNFLLVGAGTLVFAALIIIASAKQSPAANALHTSSNLARPITRSGIDIHGFLTMTMQKLANLTYPLPLLLTAGAAALVVLGSFTSWADVRFVTYAGDQVRVVSVNGTDAAGYVMLAAGSLCALLVIWRLVRQRSNWLALAGMFILFLFSGIVGVANVMDVSASTGAFAPQNIPGLGGFVPTGVGVGWGLIVATVASWAGLVPVAYLLRRDQL